ncbi:MAG: cell division protein FtsQ/DivIB [Akkermansiaceae bacterium]
MSLFKFRKKTTRSRRVVSKGGDWQKLHINVMSPRIAMLQVFSGVRKSFKILLVLVLVGLIAWGGYLGIRNMFLDNEKYAFQNIALSTNGHLDAERVMEVTAIDDEGSLFSIDTDEVRDKLLDLPEVTHAEVQYQLPGTLKVELTERVPVVWIQCEEQGMPGRSEGGVLADAKGITFPCAPSFWNAYRDLPVVVVSNNDPDAFRHGSKMKHPDVMRALNLLEEFKSIQCRAQWLPERVVLVNDYSMEAVCNDGSIALFGMYEHKRQLEDFVTVREHSQKTRREVTHINLIPKINIPVKFAGEPVLIKPRRKPITESPHDQSIRSILDRN